MARIVLALGLALALVCSCRGRGDPRAQRLADIDRAIARAGAFLAARQDADGGFRSAAYSALRDGWSLTPLAALALRVTPERAAAGRAARFIAGLVVDGQVRRAPEVSYPIYAYAIGALVLGAPENVDGDRAPRDALIAAVRGQQLAARNGWQPDDASFGGWGYAPDVPARPSGAITDDLLPANLSATVLAIGALALGGARPSDPALADAARFVARCHNRDGGFHFSPDLPDGNKAGRDASGFRSYGSMTADGIRALLRLGKPLDDPDVVAGYAWLEREFDPARNPGQFDEEIRRASSYYYWTWTAAHALEHAGRPVLRGDLPWAERLSAELLARQAADGAWRNDATEMREDEPVIATSFAVAALALCRNALGGERQAHAAWR
ncbi:MAG TPA: prenyltransferase/squalene oxidase repeat-containing protein [Kofleriaceae bacterium]|nr:prenyltransferase/squalene oxidase repeat-containing protein [Kofleriaceae bacterium]